MPAQDMLVSWGQAQGQGTDGGTVRVPVNLFVGEVTGRTEDIVLFCYFDFEPPRGGKVKLEVMDRELPTGEEEKQP